MRDNWPRSVMMRGHHTQIDTPILTVKDAAAMLRVHPCTIYRLVRDRQLPGFRIGGDWRFHREQLKEWIRMREALR